MKILLTKSTWENLDFVGIQHRFKFVFTGSEMSFISLLLRLCASLSLSSVFSHSQSK